MFGIGGFELFIILIFGFLIFGPDKLPEIAKTVGRGIARFRSAQEEMNETLGGEKLFDPSNPDEPFKNPVEVIDKLAQHQDEKRAKEKANSKRTWEAPANPKAQGDIAAKQAKEPGDTSRETPVPKTPESAQEPSDGKPLSFTERKAQYERERAARKEAEAKGQKAKTASAQGATSGPDSPEPASGPGSNEPGEGGDE